MTKATITKIRRIRQAPSPEAQTALTELEDAAEDVSVNLVTAISLCVDMVERAAQEDVHLAHAAQLILEQTKKKVGAITVALMTLREPVEVQS